MKYLFILVLCLSCLNTKAQSPTLEKAGKQLQTGFFLVAGGGGLMALSAATMPVQDYRQQNNKVGIGIGAVLTLAGVCYTYSGYSNIRKAGREKTSLLLTPSGVAYRF
jgi:hypothetical protein